MHRRWNRFPAPGPKLAPGLNLALGPNLEFGPNTDRDNAAANWGTLMAAAQSGDQQAYAQLLREVLPVLRAVVRRQGVPPAHVEDVVQDVLMAVHRVRHTYDPRLPFRPWIAAIGRRRAIDALRREGRRNAWETASPDTIEAFADPASNSDTDAGDRRAWLAEAVKRLPPRQKRALELVKLQEMSVVEAARASGQTEGAVKVNVHRAIRALRGLLDRSDA